MTSSSPSVLSSLTSLGSSAVSVGAAASSYLTSLSFSKSTLSSLQEHNFDRDFDRLHHAKIRPLIDAVDEIGYILSGDSNISLPTIVVVGDQSSGKSSQIEALTGVALPRGQNITTRVPLVLRLNNLTPDKKTQSTDDPAPYAIISTVSPLPADGERIPLSAVSSKVEAATSLLAGSGVGVVATPIYLSVFRAHGPDLTLVDLPGITRNPVKDQPKDIYHQIKNMIYKYITPETTVILCVMPCTVDLTTCECVMMSKEVDPQGIRTIGVVTKLDMAEKGIRAKLEAGAAELNLRLGVVAVRNRNQEENDKNVSFEQARETESAFFASHPELQDLVGDYNERVMEAQQDALQQGLKGGDEAMSSSSAARGGLYLGSSNLAQLLTVIQEQRIRSTLPKVRAKIRDALAEARAKYRELPQGNVTSGSDARVRVEHLLNNFMTTIENLKRGDHAVAKGEAKLHVSPRLAELYVQFQRDLNAAASNFFSADYARVVEDEIRENAGIVLPNFMSSQVFRGLLTREIFKLRAPAMALIDSTRNTLHSILLHFCKVIFSSYPPLFNRISNGIVAFLEHKQQLLIERLEEILIQEEDIFTLNTYYMDTVIKLKSAITDRLQQLQQQKSNVSPTLTAQVNDMSITIHLADLIKFAESSAQSRQLVSGGASPSHAHHQSSAASSLLGVQTLLSSHGSIVLDMQINAFSYTQIVFKRLCDVLPQLIRFHFLRTISQSTTFVASSSSSPLAAPPTHLSLHSLLQKDFIEMSDKGLMELMKEEASVAQRREKIQQTMKKMEKALAVFDAL